MADVVAAVTREVTALPPSIAQSGLAAATIVLSERLRDASPRDAAPIGRELRESLATLHAMADDMPSEELDPLAKLRLKRAERLASA